MTLFVLIDGRIPPQESDVNFINFLEPNKSLLSLPSPKPIKYHPPSSRKTDRLSKRLLSQPGWNYPDLSIPLRQEKEDGRDPRIHPTKPIYFSGRLARTLIIAIFARYSKL
jgi:hypothetical protein